MSNSPSPTTLAAAALESANLTPLRVPSQLDWTSQPDAFETAIAAALNDSGVDGVLAIYAPPVPADERLMADAINRAGAGSTKPLVAVMIGSGDGPIRKGSGVPGYAFPEQAAVALGRSFAYGRWLATESVAAPAPTRPVDPARAKAIVGDALAAGTTELDVEAAATLLSTYGITMAASRTATPATAADIAAEVGFPVAVKSTHRRPGRSARSGVALDLNHRDDVAEAVEVMVESLGSDADHLIVQEMTEPGITVRIRCQHDERLGAIVSVGYGGIDAEIIGDHADRLAPLSPSAAAAMLTDTRVGAALVEAAFDPSPLVDTLVQASQLCADHADIDLLDLNPVIVSAMGAVIADAVVRLVDRPDHDGPIRRLG